MYVSVFSIHVLCVFTVEVAVLSIAIKVHSTCPVFYCVLFWHTLCSVQSTIRVQNVLAIFVNIGSIFYCFNRNVQKMWPTKVKFDWP